MSADQKKKSRDSVIGPKYAIVKFLSNNSYEFIPMSWMIKRNKCKWPPNDKKHWPAHKISKYKDSLLPSDDTFVIYEVKLLGYADTLLRARQKAKKASLTSDVNTTDCETENRPKRRIFRKTFPGDSNPSDSSDEFDIEREEVANKENESRNADSNNNRTQTSKPPTYHNLQSSSLPLNLSAVQYSVTAGQRQPTVQNTSSLPSPVQVSTKSMQQTPPNPSPSPTYLTSPVRSPTHVPSLVHSSENQSSSFVSPAVMTSTASESTSQSAASQCNTPSANTEGQRGRPRLSTLNVANCSVEELLHLNVEFQRKMLCRYEVLLHEVRENRRFLMSRPQSSSSPNQVEPSPQKPFSIQLPLTQYQKLQEAEELLKEKSERESLKHYLKRRGGADTIDIVRRMLSGVLSNELASKFSYVGKPGPTQKKAFEKLRIKQIMFGCAGLTEHEFGDICKKWLKAAPHRKGGSSARTSGPATEENADDLSDMSSSEAEDNNIS